MKTQNVLPAADRVQPSPSGTTPVRPRRRIPRLHPPLPPPHIDRVPVLQARKLMTPDPRCCSPEDPVSIAAELMAEADCGALPVTDPGTQRIVGILTDRDLAIRVLAAKLRSDEVRVRDVMSCGVVCCHPENDIEDVQHLMRTHRVRRIPVVDKDGSVVGIISQADLAVRLARRAHPLDAEEVFRTLEVISEPQSPDHD